MRVNNGFACEIEMTDQAYQHMTNEQAAAVIRLSRSCDKLVVQKGGFDLPEGYLGFRQETMQEPPYAPLSIYGGIDVDGRVST